MGKKTETVSGIQKGIKNKIPEIVVICICAIILSIGISQKEGYHMDELLSFELADAAYNPWIVPTQPQGRLAKFMENEIQGDSVGETLQNLKETVADVLQNRGNSKLLTYQADVYEEPVWITGETFTDYITVGEDDAFQYLSVYFNVKDDNHPPLHFMLLHTMSSLFRGCVKPFVGCAINLAAVVGILILLMKSGAMLAAAFGMEEKKREAGIFAALCFGLSTGAMAMTLLIRMYAVLTFFCVALFAIHVKKWSEEEFDRHNKGLIAVTVLGFLTQYFFLFYCLVLAAVTAILLLVHKRTGEFWRYVRSMIIAAVIGVVCFPFAISDVFSSGRGVEALDNLSRGFAGFGSRLAAFAQILFDRTFGEVLAPAVIVMTLTVGITILILRKKGRSEKRNLSLAWMLVIPVVGYFLLAARMSPYLVDRYIMAIFPFVVLGGSLLLFWLFEKLSLQTQKKQAVSVLCGVVILCQLWNLWQYDGSYLYKGYRTQQQIAEELGDYPCICVYAGVGYYENLVEFTSYEKTLLVTEEELSNRQDTASIQELDHLVLLLKPYVDEEQVLTIMEEKYGFVLEKYAMRGTGVHGDIIIEMCKAEKE